MSWFGDEGQNKTWTVVSTITCCALAALPVVALILHSWPLAAFLAVFFWPSLVVIAYKSVKEKCLPVVVGGPRINLSMGAKRRSEPTVIPAAVLCEPATVRRSGRTTIVDFGE